MSSDTRRRLLALALGLGATTGCKACTERAAARDAGLVAPQDAAPAAPVASAFVFDANAMLLDVAWASNGEVVSLTPKAILRFAPEEDAPARVLRAPDDDAWERFAVARDVDVVATVSQLGALVVFDRGERRALGTFPGASRLAVTHDGKHLVVGNGRAPATSSTFTVIETTKGTTTTTLSASAHEHRARLAFDETGRWIAVSAPRASALAPEPGPDQTIVRSTDGASPEIVVPGGALAAWVGDKLVLEAERAVLVATPASPRPKRVPTCEAPSWLDHVAGRVVRVCERRVDVVRLADGTRTTIAAPDLGEGTPTWLAAAREGEDLFVSGARGVVRVDLAARKATRHEGALPPLRDGRGRPLADATEAEVASCPTCAASPKGERWIRVGSRAAQRWPLEIRTGSPSTSPWRGSTWGPKGLRGWTTTPRVNARGLDFEHEVDQGVVTRGRVRLGPEAPLLPEEPQHPEGRAPRDDCATGRHVALPVGELWFAERTGPWGRGTCLCEDYACRPFLETKGVPFDAHRDVVALRRGISPVTVALVEPDGGARAEATLDTTCVDGRLDAGGTSLVVLCRRAGTAKKDDVEPFGRADGPLDLVEIDAKSGKVTRTTPVRSPRVAHVVAAGRASYVLEASWRWAGPSFHVVKPGGGEVLASVAAFTDEEGEVRSAVARLADGRVEIGGDEALGARAVACEEGGVLKPLATCKDRVLVRGRFALDP